jgi:hypothetical protein
MGPDAHTELSRRLQRADRLEALLFSQGPSNQTFALVDAARDSGVLQLLDKSDVPYACLYKGQAAATYRAYAPYLLQLDRKSQTLERLLLNAWGSGVCYFFGSTHPPEAVHTHLRKFLFVELPDQRRAYFRFYDPRVMRAYLPTCTGQELDNLLRDLIDWIVLEDASPDVALHYVRLHERERMDMDVQARLTAARIPLR